MEKGQVHSAPEARHAYMRSLRRSAIDAIECSPCRIHDQTHAPISVIEARTKTAGVFAHAAFAQDGDAALIHQLPELRHCQAQPGRDQRRVDFDRGRAFYHASQPRPASVSGSIDS